MILYAETSAVLSWLYGEPEGTSVGLALAGAEAVAASDLTWLECQRSIMRHVAAGTIRERDAATLRVVLARSSARWTRLSIDAPVLERAGHALPNEPVRTLDAIHLASAILVQAAQVDAAMLSLDQRVRHSAAALGLTVVPA